MRRCGATILPLQPRLTEVGIPCRPDTFAYQDPPRQDPRSVLRYAQARRQRSIPLNHPHSLLALLHPRGLRL